MNIGIKIAKLRKERKITQEQLAEAVGVSIPAVSKWENQVTAPDIALLAPIARMLGTDVNDLLSFRDEITEKEVDVLLKEIQQICKKSGFETGMEKAFSLVQEYPNNSYLKLKVANAVIMNAFTIEDIEDDKADQVFQIYTAKAEKLFEEVAYEQYEDINDETREAAIAALSSHYIQSGKLKEAEELLLSVSNNIFNGSYMLPVVYLMQGELEKSQKQAQQNLLYDIQHVLGEIRSLHTVSMKEKNIDNALQYAEGYYQIGKTISLPAFLPSELLVETYLHIGDLKKAVIYFEYYIDEIVNMFETFQSSVYFNAISDSMVTWSNDGENNIKISLYKAIKGNPLYRTLLDTEEGKELFILLKRQISNNE